MEYKLAFLITSKIYFQQNFLDRCHEQLQ